MIAVHVTHEAVEKMGGIGAVIEGLVTSARYRRAFERTVLVGPLFQTDRPAAERLGPGGKVIYSSLDDIDAGGWAVKFKPIERTYQVGIIYGRREIRDDTGGEVADVEVLLVDVFRCNPDRLNLFKGELFTRFGVPSDRFERIWEYEQYVRLAEPAYEALHVIGCSGRPGRPLVILAHEYMGLPTALKAMLDGRRHVRTIFYAHEVASVRRILETHPGHDLMFYNVLSQAERSARGLEDYFPEVRGFFKHSLVKAGRHCDGVFVVGEYVGRELRFLDPQCRSLPLEVVYNGIPSVRLSLERRRRHRARMIEYGRNLFGFEPDYIFTHVARPVLSKGIWRDLRLLHELEKELARRGRTAAYFMLGTLAGRRRTKDVLRMEREYGWPVHHEQGYPDLCNGEEAPGELFEHFNRHHERVRAVLVNQFGWERGACGLRMPAEMTFADIRLGTDAEFGMSVYEPFGISQLEPLSAGAVCVLSSVCGCLGFVRLESGGELPANILVADFTRLPEDLADRPPERLGWSERDVVETRECLRMARELIARLPDGDEDVARLLESGSRLAEKMKWDRVVEELFLPAVERTRLTDVIQATPR